MRYSRFKTSLISGILLCLLSVLPAHAQEQVIFNSLFTETNGSDPNNIYLVNDTPRTFMGQAYNAADPFGAASTGRIEITRIQFVLINATGIRYEDVRANLAFYINSTGQTGGTNDVMAGLLGGGIQTFSIGENSADLLIDKTFDTPIQLLANDVGKLNNLGLTISFEGKLDAVSGYATTDNLTTAFTFGETNPITIGSNAVGVSPNYGYYRNESGKTDYNFVGTDAENNSDVPGEPGPNSVLAFRLFGQQIAAVPEPSTISLFALAGVTAGGGALARRRRRKAA